MAVRVIVIRSPRRFRSRYRHRGGSAAAVVAVAVGVLAAAGAGTRAAAHHASSPAGSTADAIGRAPAPPAQLTGSPVTEGRQMAAAYGWTGAQWSCLDALWTRESGWNPYAANPTSDARGIPQDINGWADYAPGDVTAQIAWGLSYIRSRYGTPCEAWAHETADSWY